VKAHPAHPGTSELVARAILSAARATGMPDGVFSMVQGATVEVGQALVAHPAIQAVGFTGSFRGGQALVAAAAKRPQPIPVFAEMGSANPVFVLPDALATRGDEIAKTLAASIILGSGQFCTNPGLTFVADPTDGFVVAARHAARRVSRRNHGARRHQARLRRGAHARGRARGRDRGGARERSRGAGGHRRRSRR
jgi:NADP-dependent aldehyde dehydrogenase